MKINFPQRICYTWVLKNPLIARLITAVLGLLLLSLFHVQKGYSFPRFLLVDANQVVYEVSGIVTDNMGAVVPGVTVNSKEKPSLSTSTDLNGRYILTVPANTTLRFTMVGFDTQEFLISQNTKIDLIMEASSTLIEETVVTAFGQRQRRQDVIGSVTSISPKDLKTPVSNLTAALQGRVSGIVSMQRSGEPGADNADFFIRGVGTFGVNQKPLILIDNMEVSADELARIPVDDIENFSVLRDATAAAVYGSRGANGVILVTTKIGREGTPRINFRAEYRISTPTRALELADPITWMEMNNEAVRTRDPLGLSKYAQEKIERTKAGTDPINYPAVNWLDELTKRTTSTQNYNLSIAGGGQVATYNVSGNFTQDNGLLKMNPLNNFNSNVNFQVYNLRSNINVNITKSTQLMIRTVANLQNYSGPPVSGEEAFKFALRANPVLFQPAYQPGPQQSYIKHPMFGNSNLGEYLNPYAEIMRGYSEKRRSNLQVQLELKQDLSNMVLEGLNYRGLVNLTRNSYFTQSRAYNPFYYSPVGFDTESNANVFFIINPDKGSEYLNFVPGTREQSAIFYMENQLAFNRVYQEKHSITAMGINTIRSNVSTPTDNPTLINTLPFRNVSFSGNFTYGFDNRYHAQFTFGYNGSERFDAKYRWSFFPSFGLAWNVSNEPYFEPMKDIVSALKGRFTHGILGNDNISDTRFFYLSDVDLENADWSYSFGLPIGGQYALPGVLIKRYANSNVQWEISRQTNLGIDLSLLNSKLTFTGDFYKQLRDNIVQQRSVPSSTGFVADVLANVGKYASRGFDAELVYSNSFNQDLWIQGRGTFTYATGEYVFYEEPNYQYDYLSRIGLSSSQTRGYIAERLFIDDNEVYNSPRQNFGGEPVLGGDIKYLDVNRDGVINGDDVLPIGHPTIPEINWGFGLSTGYKSMDFSFFFSGVGRTSLFINPINYDSDRKLIGTAPFGSESAPNAVLKAWADSHWSEENKDLYAQWPRLSQNAITNNVQTSTYWMRDASFVRLKQVELGYTLNQRFTERYKFKNFRVYLSATNLLTWSSFKLWDPEKGGNGLGYPLQRVFNIGINASL